MPADGVRFRPGRRRGDAARAARDGTETGWVRRMTASPAFPTGTGTRRPGAGTPPTRSPKRQQTRLSGARRSEEHTSELQSRSDLVCRLLLEKKKKERSGE